MIGLVNKIISALVLCILVDIFLVSDWVGNDLLARQLLHYLTRMVIVLD